MPEISRFFGITIRMYIDEHNPPHFHAIYGDYEAEVKIESLKIITGSLPLPQTRKVIEWASLHISELMANWNNLRSEIPSFKIEPLSK